MYAPARGGGEGGDGEVGIVEAVGEKRGWAAAGERGFALAWAEGKGFEEGAVVGDSDGFGDDRGRGIRLG